MALKEEVIGWTPEEEQICMRVFGSMSPLHWRVEEQRQRRQEEELRQRQSKNKKRTRSPTSSSDAPLQSAKRTHHEKYSTSWEKQPQTALPEETVDSSGSLPLYFNKEDKNRGLDWDSSSYTVENFSNCFDHKYSTFWRNYFDEAHQDKEQKAKERKASEQPSSRQTRGQQPAREQPARKQPAREDLAKKQSTWLPEQALRASDNLPSRQAAEPPPSLYFNKEVKNRELDWDSSSYTIEKFSKRFDHKYSTFWRNYFDEEHQAKKQKAKERKASEQPSSRQTRGQQPAREQPARKQPAREDLAREQPTTKKEPFGQNEPTQEVLKIGKRLAHQDKETSFASRPIIETKHTIPLKSKTAAEAWDQMTAKRSQRELPAWKQLMKKLQSARQQPAVEKEEPSVKKELPYEEEFAVKNLNIKKRVAHQGKEAILASRPFIQAKPTIAAGPKTASKSKIIPKPRMGSKSTAAAKTTAETTPEFAVMPAPSTDPAPEVKAIIPYNVSNSAGKTEEIKKPLQKYSAPLNQCYFDANKARAIKMIFKKHA